MSLRYFLLGSAALALVGCSAPATDQETAETPDESVSVEVDADTLATTNADGKTVIASEADLPRTEIALTKKPSEIVLGDGPEFDALVEEVDAAVTDLLENYDIQDRATKRSVIGNKRVILNERGDWQGVLDTSPQMRELAGKPAEREMTGLLGDSFARAAMATGETSGDAFASWCHSTSPASDRANRVTAHTSK